MIKVIPGNIYQQERLHHWVDAKEKDMKTRPAWWKTTLIMATLLAVAFLTTPAGAASFQGLGYLPGVYPPEGDLPPNSYSDATGVSADGSVVVGTSLLERGSNTRVAYRWTQEGGMVGAPQFGSAGLGVSADGSVVVGSYGGFPTSRTMAFRWFQDGRFMNLGTLPGDIYIDSHTSASAASADGSVMVGSSLWGTLNEAFRFTEEDHMVSLGAGGATDISADGNVVVGGCPTNSGYEAFRWTQDGGMVGLGDLPSGEYESRAFGVSADGSVVVGYGKLASGYEAFRWTEGGGMVGLGDLPGGEYESRAFGVSADGSVIVGSSSSEAFIWDSANGMSRLVDVLVSLGLGGDLTGWTLTQASGISDDGLTIVGYGINPDGYPEAWRAVVPAVPVPGSLLLLGTGLLRLGALGWRRRKSQQAPTS